VEGPSTDRAEHSSPAATASRWRWLETRSGALVPAGASLAALLWLALVPRSWGSQSLVDFALARCAWHAPLATLLLPSAPPALTLLEALPAAAGLRALAVFGAVCGALAVVLASELAHALGLAHPNVASWLVATSLSMAAAALASPEPAIAGACLAGALLWYFEGRLGAAWALGVLPLVRPELLVVTLGVVVWDALGARRARVVLAALAPVASYAVAQTLYHRGVGWVAGLAVVGAAGHGGLRQALRGALGVAVASSPVLASFCAFGLRPSKPRVWLLGVVVVATCCAGGAAASVALLPLFGVLAVSALDTADGASVLRRFGWFGAVAVAAAFAFFGRAGQLAALAVLAAAAARLVWARPRVAQAMLVASAAAVACLQLPRVASRQRRVDARARAALHALKSSGIWRDQTLYTDRVALRCERCDNGRRIVLLLDATRAVRLVRAAPLGARAALARDFRRSRVLLDVYDAPIDRSAVYALSDDPRAAAWRRRLEAAGAIATRVSRLAVYFWPASGRRLPGESPEL
jgi:hypothetical protein